MIASTLLKALNIGFFLGGGAILSIGILAIVKPEIIYQLTSYLAGVLASKESNVLESIDLNGLIEKNAIIIISVGGFLFLFGFLGFCGAMQKSALLLSAYVYLVLAILMAEAALAVYGYMYSDRMELQIKSVLKENFDQYEKGIGVVDGQLSLPNAAADLFWDTLQVQFACCGVDSYRDWANASKWSHTVGGIPTKLPLSCCTRTAEGLKKEIDTLKFSDFKSLPACMDGTPGNFNELGCYPTVRQLVLDNKTIVIAVFAVIILVELLAIGCACWLKSNLK